MENKSFNDYSVAHISQEDIQTISNLEKTLSDKSNQDIVLIAYQPNKKAKA
jgi:hypothetical protein